MNIGRHRDPLDRRRSRGDEPNPEIWGDLQKVHKTDNPYISTTIDLSTITDEIPVVRSHRMAKYATGFKKIRAQLSNAKKRRKSKMLGL